MLQLPERVEAVTPSFPLALPGPASPSGKSDSQEDELSDSPSESGRGVWQVSLAGESRVSPGWCAKIWDCFPDKCIWGELDAQGPS